MSRRAATVCLLLVLGIGLALRVWRLTERSLWFDEAVSYTTVERFPWAEMIDRTAQAVHPPLYYMVLRLWTALFGTSVAALRSLSVSLGALTVLGTYVFCRDVTVNRWADEVDARGRESQTGRATGVFAAGLVAASSVHIEWSQQARMYMLGTALAVWSTWLLVRALRSNKTSWWLGYSVSAAALLYTHNYGLFTVLGQALFLLGCLVWSGRGAQRAADVWKPAAAVLAVAVLYFGCLNCVA